MKLLLLNIVWGTWNLFLAFLALAFVYASLRFKNKILSFIMIGFGVLFAPNTIYITTDLAHLFRQWNQINSVLRPFLLIQYVIFIPLGIIVFLLTIKEIEKFYEKYFSKKYLRLFLICLNFIIAFGVVIGRVQRANSWHVFTKPLVVLNNVIKTLTSLELILYTLVFGIFSNLIYFGFRNKLCFGGRMLR